MLDSLTIRFLTGFSGSQDAQNCACLLKFMRQENGTPF